MYLFGAVVFVLAQGKSELNRGDSISAGDQLLSDNMAASLNLQASDGNLVLYSNRGQTSVLWSADTTGNPGDQLLLQDDGNLVVISKSGKVVFSTGANPNAMRAAVTNDCKLALFTASNVTTWTTNTTCPSVPTPPPPPPPSPPLPVDCSTIKNKVIAGYQGWFGGGNDVPGYGWWHWAEKTQDFPGPGNTQFDMFPDLREYPQSALNPTHIQWANGSSVNLYENVMPGVVDLHFKWMYQYHMDGVFPQRFVGGLRGGAATIQKNKILAQVNSSACKYNRTYAVMYDITNAGNDWADVLKSDWTNYTQRYTSSSCYLHEGGKPVVAIFGLGLNNHPPMPTATEAIAFINWMKSRAYVIGSGPYFWRTGNRDALPNYQAVHAAFDAIMPWAVGRYNSISSFKAMYELQVKGDAELTHSRNQGYAPISYPGYSFHNSDATKPFNGIPRLGGEFFRTQFQNYLELKDKATFYYIAMFDEINEGTAIYKTAATAKDVPANVKFLYNSIDGIPTANDAYLVLTWEFTDMAKQN
eukprot:m.34715 g.34715  ORF g.34715 m.34715 type:complete len:528 (-) comp8767_c1_seq1:2928-4511(-)